MSACRFVCKTPGEGVKMARFQGKHFDRKIDQKKGAALRALSKIGVTSALTAVMVAEAVTPSFAASLQQVSNGAATAFPSVHAAVPVVEHSFSQEPSKLIASAVQGEQLSAEDAKAALDEAQRQSDAAKAQAEEAQKAEAEAKAAQAAAQRRADEAARAQAAEKQAAIDRVIADTEAKIAAAEKAQAEADAADKAQQAAKAAKDEADQKVAAAQKAADDAAKKLADAQASYDKLDQAEVA